jgi:dienelactone hydrolase
MFQKYLILILLILGFTFQISFAENIKFKSTSKGKDGNLLLLTGILTKPEGNGPFPAVVLLHGCRGLEDGKIRSEAWSSRLVDWGYVTLQLDSFRPRNVSNVCSDGMEMISMGFTRARDAYDSKTFLAEIPFVDQSRIAVMGWSHGGITVIEAIYKSFINFLDTEATPFKAAIAFYPYCGKTLDQFNSPVLILIGKKDDWTFASNCSYLMPSEPTDHEVILKVYPEAYHGFDWEDMDENYEGHRLLYDPIATQDAIIQVKNFLAKHLK